jgi:signal transduction histidine kinase
LRPARLLAPAIAATTTAAFVAAIVLDAKAGTYGGGLWEGIAWSLATFSSTAVGFLLATKRRRNPIGWLLLANGLVISGLGLAETYADFAMLADPGALPGGNWAVLFNERAWPLLFAAVTAIAWVFPDGQLPSPRWRRFALAGAASFAALFVISLLAAERFEPPFAGVDSPLPELSEAVIGVPFMIAGLGSLACLFGGAFAVRTRLRRSHGVERLQFRWLAYAAALVPLAVVTCLVEAAISGRDGNATLIAVVVVLTAMPLAIGVAVMRYRLYEIDRLINRTLVYVGLSAALAVAFAAVSLGLGVAIGSGSTLPTAAATLAVALLFGPLRSRMQLLVDRRFNRDRYEALRAVESFVEDLRAGRAAPEEIERVLRRALGDHELELLFALAPEGMQVDAGGHPVQPRATGGRERTPVRRGDLALATVVHSSFLGERPDLLESVINAAGLPIEIARLRVEVRRQLAEVEESRARIVTAGDEERRRLERDLHDGAQQRLVSIGLALRHLQGKLPGGSELAEALDSTVDEVAGAIAELRELARGVRPASLDDGLAPALRELAARSHLQTRVEATSDRFAERFETAAYFVASEALANAAKHADASTVTVSAGRSNGSLVVSVRDDGVGGAAPSPGSGLAGISDRVAALGGNVTVASSPGEGTVVTAELPCGS